MNDRWCELPFNEAVIINPPVRLERGMVYPFVDMAAVRADARNVYPPEEREFRGGGSRFHSDDTLMARITPCLENGKIARYVAQGAELEAHGSTEFIVVRGRPNVTDNDFAYYLTRWNTVRDYAIGQMTGTSGRQRVPTDSLDHLIIPVPPVPEQRAIAHILGTLDDKIELNRRMNETLEEMARALFKSWFVDFDPVRAKMEGHWRRGESLPGMPAELYELFPDGMVDSELGEIPAGWEVKALGDIAKEARVSVQPQSIKPGTPCIGLEHMPRRCLALSDWHIADGVGSSKFRFTRGDILFGKLRPYFHKVGIAPLEGVCSTDIAVVAPAADCWFGFVLGHISSDAFVDYTDTTSTGTRMPRTKWRDMARYEIPLPDRVLAETFTLQIQPWVKQIVSAIHESRALASLRDTLLPRLISGKLQVTQRRKRQHD